MVWIPGAPGFAQLTAAALGNAGTASDGFDSAFAAVLNAFSSLDALDKALGQLIVALDAAHASTAAIPTGDLTAQIAAAQTATAVSISAISKAIGALSFSPAAAAGIAPAPTPPTYGVDGVGIGQTGSTGVSLNGPVEAGLIGTGVGTVATETLTIGLEDGLIQAGSAFASVLGAVATFAPIVGAFVGLALLLKQFIGKGCGSACIDAAKAEQIYELWADNLLAVLKLGMISTDQALAGMALAIQNGVQHENEFNDAQSRKGATNLTNVIRAEMLDVPAYAHVKRVPLDLAKAREAYISGPGWYPDSVAAAAQLTDEYLTSLTPATA
jgi:hypothetical protein